MPHEKEKGTILIDDKKILSIESTRSMSKEK
jgi:hypothetical protein